MSLKDLREGRTASTQPYTPTTGGLAALRNPAPVPTSTIPPNPYLQTGIDVAKGFGKGALQTVSGLSQLIQPVANKIDNFNSSLHGAISGQTPQQIQAEQERLRVAGQADMSKLKDLSTTHNTAQNFGAGAEQLGEFFIPGGALTKVGKIGKVAEIASKLPTYGKVAGKLAIDAGIGYGLNDLHGGDTEGNVEAGLTNALLPYGLKYGLKAIKGGNTLLRSVTGLAPTEGAVSRNIQSRIKELTNVVKNNSVLNKIVNKESARGNDIIGDVSKTNLLEGVIDNNGTIRAEEAIAKINEHIKPQEDVIYNNLVKEGKGMKFSDVHKALQDAVEESGVKGAAKVRALKAADDEIAGLILDATRDGKIPISVLHEAKVNKYANLNYYNPESSNLDKAFAKKLKELVEKNTSSVNVKKLNEELSKYYSIQNFLEKLDGKKVAGGRLGKYFGQVIGATVGSHFGPLGTIAGAELGGVAKGIQMSTKFGKGGKPLEISQVMKDAIESGKPEIPYSSKIDGSLNTTQSNTSKPTINGIRDSIARNGKGLLGVAGLGLAGATVATNQADAATPGLTEFGYDSYKSNLEKQNNSTGITLSSKFPFIGSSGSATKIRDENVPDLTMQETGLPKASDLINTVHSTNDAKNTLDLTKLTQENPQYQTQLPTLNTKVNIQDNGLNALSNKISGLNIPVKKVQLPATTTVSKGNRGWFNGIKSIPLQNVEKYIPLVQDAVTGTNISPELVLKTLIVESHLGTVTTKNTGANPNIFIGPNGLGSLSGVEKATWKDYLSRNPEYKNLDLNTEAGILKATALILQDKMRAVQIAKGLKKGEYPSDEEIYKKYTGQKKGSQKEKEYVERYGLSSKVSDYLLQQVQQKSDKLEK